jgi:HK97 family phage major capsid protein
MEQNELLEKVLGEIGKVHDTGKANHGEIVALKEKADKLEAEVQKSHGDLELVKAQAAAEIEVVKAALADTHGGKSGAGDFLNELAKAIRGVWSVQKLHRQSDEVFKNGQKVSEVVKAAATFDTTTAATAGNLLPTIVQPGIKELMDIYGNLYPRVTKISVPAGQALRVNSDSANPVAAWRATQGGAMTEEATPMAFGTDTITTQLLYVYQTIANELMSNPAVNFAAVASVRGIRACVRKLEYDMLAAASAPSAGVVAASTSQTTMASATFALVNTFLKECAADNAWAIDYSNAFFMHPRDVLTLAAQPVGASELTGMLVWGDPRRGIPTTLMGHEVIVHPGCNNGTNNYIFLGDPSNIFLGESGGFGVDFSDQVGFKDFETAMRVYGHFDWSVMQTGQWHRAIVTA